MSTPMKVLLTGGTGFLGEYLLAELLERGHSVWALYRSESRRLDTIRYLSSMDLPRSSGGLHWFKGEFSTRTVNGIIGAESVRGSTKWTRCSTARPQQDFI